MRASAAERVRLGSSAIDGRRRLGACSRATRPAQSERGSAPEGYELPIPRRSRGPSRARTTPWESSPRPAGVASQGGGAQGPMDLTVLAESSPRVVTALARQSSTRCVRCSRPRPRRSKPARRYMAGDKAGATARLVAAFTMYQRDPWPHRRPFTRALELRGGPCLRGPGSERGALRGIGRAVRRPRARFASAARARRHRPRRPDGASVRRGLRAARAPGAVGGRAFLKRRADCYERIGSPLAAKAQKDLEAFRAADPSSR